MNGTALAALALAVASGVWPRRRIAPMSDRWWRRVAQCGGTVAGVGLLVTQAATTSLAAGMLLGTAWLRRRGRCRRRRALVEARELESALDVLIGELRIGAHPVRALSVAAAETADTAVGAALHTVAARARLGADVAAGLRSAAGGSALGAQWERLAQCWRLADEHGLAIAALMRAAQRDLAERQRFSGQVVAGLAGARATAAILAGLPVLGVLLGELIGARPVGFLLGGGGGGWCLVVGVSLSCAGLWWSDRIADAVVS